MSRSTVRRVRPLAMLVLLLFGCSHAGQHPPAGGGWSYGGMVAVANPLAAEAAVAVLRNGGHAVDAAIAAHAVLGLVEPQSSGLGGGAFMLVYERATNELSAYDGRETAPAGATPDMFMDHGEEMNFLRAWQSGRSVGTPGMVALYALAHERHGRLPMADVMQRAIELAEEGFEVSPRLAGFLARVGAPTRLDDNPATAAYFFPGGKPLAAGDIRDNPEYAHTLRRFVAEGPSAFYAGELAREIVAAAQAEPDGGTLSMEDLAGYKVAVRKPICGQAGADRICGLPPPSSGLAEIMILGLYDRLADPARMQDGLDLAAFVDAQRLAYADRDHYVADADFVPVPVHE
ncbi:MAG: gamma-glutamyltransferase, partial [Gammaproteobacteria bacterium]